MYKRVYKNFNLKPTNRSKKRNAQINKALMGGYDLKFMSIDYLEYKKYYTK